LRLNFPRRIATPAALRQTLKQLADQARAAAPALQQVPEQKPTKTGKNRNASE
jgi:hypothetical protein